MTLRDGGLDGLFPIDWLPATDETAGWSIAGYVAVLEEAVQFLGESRRRLPRRLARGVYPGLDPEHVHHRWGAH